MSDLRRLLFANQTRAYEGYPLVISRSVALRYLKQYQIYGNSQQDGTPTPEHPVEVISVGDKTVNLFDKDNVNWIKEGINPYFFTSGTGVIAKENSPSYEGERLLYIPCKPNTTYTVSFGNSYTKRMGTFPTVPVSGDIPSVYISDFTDQTKSITSGSTDNYLVVQLYINSNYTSGARSANIIPNLMIVEGSVVPSSYVPYGKYQIPVVVTGTSGDPTTTPIYLNAPLRKVGDYADYIDYKKGQVVRNVGIYVFDGTEGFTKGSAFFTTNTSFLPSKAGDITPICTHFKGIRSYKSRVADSLTMAVNGPDGRYIGCVYLYADRSLYATAADFKSWLASQYAAGTPVTVYYPLATPVVESIVAPALPTMAGSTTYTTETVVKPSNMKGIF